MTAMLCLMLGAVGLGASVTEVADQTEGMEAAQRIFEAVDNGKSSSIDGLSFPSGEDAAQLKDRRCKGHIELKNVNFSYPERRHVQVCRNYNLVIEPGQVVALVGPSGSGKSTIMNLLLRFYDPDSGSVLLDGKDIRDVNVRWLRSQIG